MFEIINIINEKLMHINVIIINKECIIIDNKSTDLQRFPLKFVQCVHFAELIFVIQKFY